MKIFTIFKLFFALFSIVILFTITLSTAKAQSCSGYVVDCCTEIETFKTPEGCKDSCEFAPYPCTECTGTTIQCTEFTQASCTDDCQPQCYTGQAQDLCGPASGGGGPYCGDGICQDTVNGCSTCPQDCGTCAPVCGDGACNGLESCSSCVSDCGACGGPPGPYCGDASCNGTENCSNCAGDCGSCAPAPQCGDGICNGTETCSTCSADCGSCTSGPYCGDYVCNGTESCSSCPFDCGSCATDYCGDGVCGGFESCLTCDTDCGTCSTSNAWWQVQGGMIGAQNSNNSSLAISSQVPDSSLCSGTCYPYLSANDLAQTSLTDGFPIYGSGIMSVNGFVTQRSPNTFASNTKKSRFEERYEYFYRQSPLGLNPTDDFASTFADAQKPTYNPSKIHYFRSGNLTIQRPWNVAAGETYIIFVDGTLILRDGDGASDRLISVDDGGFLAFIVSNRIIVRESLGNTVLNSLTPNVEGVFIADNTFDVQSRGIAGGGDDRFVGEGIFVGWGGVNLDRDFDDGAGRGVENNDKAAEVFIYRPNFIRNLPNSLKFPHRLWQEVNPGSLLGL